MNNPEAFYITGATGFLGNHILKLLTKKDNVQIFVFVMPNDKNLPNLKKYQNVKISFGNLLSKEDVTKFLSIPFEGKKYLIHCAGKITTLKSGDESVIKINYEGSKNIVDAVKNNNFTKVVYISSVDALTINDTGVILEQDIYDKDKVVGIYGKSKCLANNYFLDNLDNSVIILPSALFGPEELASCPINSAIKKMVNNKLPAIVKGGYNLVDVRDCAEAIINACYYGKNKNSYILSGHYITIKELMKECSNLSACKEIRFTVPHFLIGIADPFIRLKCKITHKTPLFTSFSMYCLRQNSNYSYQKAQTDLSFTPRPLLESLKDTVNISKNDQ